MKLFNLYVRDGTAEFSQEFKTDGERIEDARRFEFDFSHATGFANNFIYRLTIDHAGNPIITNYTDDELEIDNF